MAGTILTSIHGPIEQTKVYNPLSGNYYKDVDGFQRHEVKDMPQAPSLKVEDKAAAYVTLSPEAQVRLQQGRT